jgi:hypothetical protein
MAYPLLALLVAAVFAGFWHWRGRRAAGIAALGWAAYGFYEISMKARILCSGECNIRVDLLLIYSVLLVLSVTAIARSLRRRTEIGA